MLQNVMQVQSEQRRDPKLVRLIEFFTDRTLPSDPHDTNIVVGLAIVRRDTMW